RSRIGSSRAKPDGNLAGREINNAGRNKEGRYFARAAFKQRLVLALDDGESPDAGPDEHAGSFGPFGIYDESRLFHSECSRRDRVMDEEVHLLHILLFEPLQRIEGFYFLCD